MHVPDKKCVFSKTVKTLARFSPRWQKHAASITGDFHWTESSNQNYTSCTNRYNYRITLGKCLVSRDWAQLHDWYGAKAVWITLQSLTAVMLHTDGLTRACHAPNQIICFAANLSCDYTISQHLTCMDAKRRDGHCSARADTAYTHLAQGSKDPKLCSAAASSVHDGA